MLMAVFVRSKTTIAFFIKRYHNLTPPAVKNDPQMTKLWGHNDPLEEKSRENPARVKTVSQKLIGSKSINLNQHVQTDTD